MHLDHKLSIEEASTGREHRSRGNAQQEPVAQASPGTPTERTVAGGPTPVSRSEQQPTRDAAAASRETPAAARRRSAERELTQLLRLPADTSLSIHVDPEQDQVRFEIRERRTGRLLREVPPEETRPLLDKLKEFSGALVDRSL